jgi:hypothetical protein
LKRIVLTILLLALPVLCLADDLTLSWTHPDDDRVTGYYVYHGTGKPYTQVDVGYVAEYIISAYNAGDTFYVTATSYDADGNESVMGEILKVQVTADGVTLKNLSIMHPGRGNSTIQRGSGNSAISFGD